MDRRWRRRGARGAVAVEFIIVIIPFAFLFAGVVQLALISVAKLSVHYAAQCAARAAMVVVPDEEEGGHDAGNARIKDAAIYALLPIAPASDGTSNIANGFAKGGGWSEVSRSTGVLFNQSRLGGDEWDAQITTRVVFAYHCTIPLASRFFCSPVAELPSAARRDLSAAGISPGPGRYLILRAQQTLTKQGRPNPRENPRRML